MAAGSWTPAGNVQSRDARRHIDWLLRQLEHEAAAIAELKADGHLVDICVYWLSAGQGGPTLDSSHMVQLGKLGVELWFDIYFAGNDGAG
jgi:hypothetical protein